MVKIPFFIINSSNRRKSVYDELANILIKYFPSTIRALNILDNKEKPTHYFKNSIINSLLLSSIFASIILIITFILQGEALVSILISFLIGLMVFLLFMGLFIIYPDVLVKKYAEEIDTWLVSALNDLTMQVTAGSSLMHSIYKISKSDYGKVSEEFMKVVKKTSGGMNLEKALIEVANDSNSEFLKRAFWQLATVTHTGSSIEDALRDIIRGLEEYQNNRIRQYSQVLNFYILIYFMLAVVLPSLSILLLTIIATFLSKGGIKLGNLTIPLNISMIGLTIIYLIGQVIALEYIRVKRPML